MVIKLFEFNKQNFPGKLFDVVTICIDKWYIIQEDAFLSFKSDFHTFTMFESITTSLCCGQVSLFQMNISKRRTICYAFEGHYLDGMHKKNELYENPIMHIVEMKESHEYKLVW